MANKKRRQGDDDEGTNHSASDAGAPPERTVKSKSAAVKGKASSKAKTAKKPKFAHSEEESSPSPEDSKPSPVKAHKTAGGEKYVDLGKKKRVTVRPFKGQVYIDIREYYGTDGDEKPGKKGISLAKEQWEALKQNINTLDSLYAEQVKG